MTVVCYPGGCDHCSSKHPMWVSQSHTIMTHTSQMAKLKHREVPLPNTGQGEIPP